MRGWAPGGRGPLAPLQEMIRQSYESSRVAIDASIAERKRVGVPLDDDTDWAAESKRAGELANAINAEDTARYRKALEGGLIATRGALAPLGPYEPDARLEGIHARFRTVPRRVWWTSVGRVQELHAKSALIDAKGLDVDGHARGQLLADIEEARAELVKYALVELVGLDGAHFTVVDKEPQSPEAMGVIVESGLVDALFAAARDFQGLDPEGRERFGLELPPTSHGSSAIGAQSARDSSSDATAEHPQNTLRGLPTRRTSVLDVDSFDTLGLPTPSPSGERPTEGSSASTAPS